MSVDTVYTNASLMWGGSTVQIINAQGNGVALFPTLFLSSCNVNNWSYIYDVIRFVAEDPMDNIGVILDAEGDRIDERDPRIPTEGVYTYVYPGHIDLPIMRAGPQGSRRGRAADISETSTVSHSSRSSTHQNSFRKSLMERRERVDVITGQRENFLCLACHIVPQSRLDIYQQLLHTASEWARAAMFTASAGLLLPPNLHSLFDDYSFSLLYKDEKYYVHVFDPYADSALTSAHGKIISSVDFGCRRPQDLPNPVFVNWHYQQAAMKRLRGYAIGMTVNAQ